MLSPSTQDVDRRRKLPLYFREGVSHAWLVEPLTRTLEVLRRAPEGWLLVATHGGDETVRAEPFDAVPLALGRRWLPGRRPKTP